MTNQDNIAFAPDAGAILVVDDETDLREAITYFLQKKGFEVLQAKNGKEALSILDKRTAEFGLSGVQAILSDWMMPEMGGLELLRACRSNNLLNVPFVMISGAVTQEQLLEALRLGADAVIVKPFPMDLLIRKIQDAIGHHAKREIANLMRT